MSSHRENSRRTDDGLRRFSQGHGSQWVESDDDDEPALYCTDDFRMKCMKVLRCSKKYCHDWTRCPFAHPGEKATRRDPMLGVYTGIACPDMRKDQRCPRGHYCPYAHNVFEYWLHPTRYRTALCRDVERCSRKICFFAHQVDEIRTNVERPYVSPQQLVAATETAALDPRVQAEFQAAKEQTSSSKPGPMAGMFQGLVEPSESEVFDSTRLSLSAPWASRENQEVSNALSSLMRGAGGPMPKPLPDQAGPSNPARASGNFKSLPPPGPEDAQGSLLRDSLRESQLLPDLSVRRSLSDPASRSGNSPGSREASVSRSLPFGKAEATGSRESPPWSRSNSFRRAPWQKEEQLTLTPPSAQTVPAATREDKVSATMFPSHLNTMVQMPSHQSLGGQQNLVNAATHLMEVSQGGGLWSTPRGPLETPLYSTSSSISERQRSVEGPLSNRLDTVYKQKLRKRQAKRASQSRDVQYHINYPPPYTLQPPLYSNTPSSMYSQYSQNPTVYHSQPRPQQLPQHQQQSYLRSMHEMQMHHQQVEALQKEEERRQLQQAIELELQTFNPGVSGLSHPSTPLNHHSRDTSSLRSALDSSYEFQPGQMTDYQGLFSGPRENAVGVQSQYGNMFPGVSHLHSGQSLLSFGRESSLTGQMPRADSELRGRDSFYGMAENETRGLTERAEPDSTYRPFASVQLGSPNLEEVFSRKSFERAASAQDPSASTGQQNVGNQ